jgi:hypothetical protein
MTSRAAGRLELEAVPFECKQRLEACIDASSRCLEGTLDAGGGLTCARGSSAARGASRLRTRSGAAFHLRASPSSSSVLPLPRCPASLPWSCACWLPRPWCAARGRAWGGRGAKSAACGAAAPRRRAAARGRAAWAAAAGLPGRRQRAARRCACLRGRGPRGDRARAVGFRGRAAMGVDAASARGWARPAAPAAPRACSARGARRAARRPRGAAWLGTLLDSVAKTDVHAPLPPPPRRRLRAT